MKKYIKSSERSERLAGIQRGREKRTSDSNSQAKAKCFEAIDRFQAEYGARVAEVWETWAQLMRMKEVGGIIRLSSGNCNLPSRHGGPYIPHLESYPADWFSTPVKFWNDERLYLSKDGRIGHRFEIPHGFMAGEFKESDLNYPEYSNAVASAITKLPSVFVELEDYIYEIADSIEE